MAISTPVALLDDFRAGARNLRRCIASSCLAAKMQDDRQGARQPTLEGCMVQQAALGQCSWITGGRRSRPRGRPCDIPGVASARTYPIAYPNGSWPTGVAFSGVGTVGAITPIERRYRRRDFPAGYIFTVGDLVQIGNGDLHRVMEAATDRPIRDPAASVAGCRGRCEPEGLQAVLPDADRARQRCVHSRPGDRPRRVSFTAIEERS